MNRFFKRTLSMILAVLMVFGSAPQIVSAMMLEKTAVCEEENCEEHSHEENIAEMEENIPDSEEGGISWEQGTIASADGTNNNAKSRFRTADYLKLESYSGVSINEGYTMTNFVYDENHNYLGTSSWIGEGIPFKTSELMEKYPAGVYFRVVFRAADQRNLTEEDITASGVKFYLAGEEVPEPDLGFTFENLGSIGTWQDGDIHDGKLFVFGAAGTGAVFDIETLEKLGGITLDKKDVIKPHANSVCFGSTYYEKGDKYPLLYVNIYNNYWEGYADKKEGTCCVYRITEENGVFSSKLVQVIKIGFTDVYDLWNSAEDNGYPYYLPYGNFVVDTDKDKLWVFVLRNGEEQTRFFEFDLPKIGDGVYNETYGCNLVTLESEEIIKMFDTEHLIVLQGCCYYGGKILSVTGLGTGRGASPYIQVIDPEKGEIEKNICFEEIGITNEPEMISVDPIDGRIYYASVDGILRELEISAEFGENIPDSGEQTENSVPVITKQPENGKAKLGEKYCVTVEAEGEDLTYTWYGKDFGASEWFKSGVTDNTYDDIMTEKRANREVYCVISDANGNSVTTDTVKLILLPSKIWEQWTQPVTLTAETYPTYGGSSTGYYEKGRTFGGIIYSSTFRDGTDVLWNLNPSTYYSAVANPASLLYTVDYRGRVSNESSWAGSVCSTTALKACGYEYPYTTAEISEGFTEKNDHSIDNLEFGDILWVKGHVAGIIGVNKDGEGKVLSVKVIEQASQVKVFEITAENWDSYFESHWTSVYYGDFDKTKTEPEEYPENLSIIFERGNNTYVTDYSEMLFYIPEAEKIFFTKNGETAEHEKTSFPTKTVNETTVYDLASLFDGTGDYYFHTEKDKTDICIKIISKGTVEISGNTATLGGYENCEPLGYRVINILDETKSSEYNFFGAPEGYTSAAVNLSYRKLSGDSFKIENIPEDSAGWKLEIFYDTGYGWARELSENIMNSGTAAYSTLSEAALALREKMIARESPITIRVAEGISASEVLKKAWEHTGVPNEGDYIRHNQVGNSYTTVSGEDENGAYTEITYTFNWLSTAEQEAEVDAAVDAILAELDLWDKTDYEKIKGAYDWVTENVEYDFNNEDNDEDLLCHSTYAAAVLKEAVCQGYATLYYRMMLELGVDCRYIRGMAGYVEVESHAWNIVALEGKYYNMDATWDRDLMGYYRMFLCTESNFTEHIPDSEYTTAEWKAKYPMAVVPYVFNVAASGKLPNGMEWVLDGDTGTLTVAGTGAIPSYRYNHAPWYDYKDSVKAIVVSEGITEVGERAFYWCVNCTSLSLPDSLVAIREYGFNNLRNLEYVTLPENLKIMEFCAFSECVALKEIVIPDSVTTCGTSVFSNCYGLQSAVIGNGLKIIPDSMFFGDKNLRTVTLPEGLTEIGDTAFADCGIYYFTVPASLTTLGTSVFSGCRNLYDFAVEEGNQYYKAVGGVLFTKDGKTLVAYPGGDVGSYYYVPEGTVTIARSAFNEAYRLQYVYFPDSLREIKPYAFAYCNALWSVTFTPNITRIGDSAFRSCKGLYSAIFENPDVVLESSVFADCDTMEFIYLPSRLKEIPSGLFYGSQKLSEVEIPSTVTKIGSSAFLDCDSLVSITVPGSVKSVEQQAFDYCDKLETIIFEEGVQKIGWLAIRNNPKLKKVVIPSSVTTFERPSNTSDKTFDACPNVVVYVNCGTAGWNYVRNYSISYSASHPYTNATVVSPTCTSQGYTRYYCNCGTYSYNTNYTSALGHSYKSAVTPPTCTEEGFTTYTCTRCGYSYTGNYVPENGHSLITEGYVEPTCTEPGYSGDQYCENCDYRVKGKEIPETGHSYSGAFCTVCGAENPGTENYEGKVISIMGDSISTFSGYLPVEDGFNRNHPSFYPKHDVTEVGATWWMQIVNDLDAKLGINESWSGSYVFNSIDENSGNKGPDAAMASVTRIKNLGSNGTPDIIFFFGGTNDIAFGSPLGSFNPETAPTETDLSTIKWESYADAYVAAIMRMQYYYPDAHIIAILPTINKSYYTNETLEEYNSVMRAICSHYEVPYVDLAGAGFESSMLGDATHPNAKGMDFITNKAIDVLSENCPVEPGENVVYSVKHNVDCIKPSLAYYKGVSEGKTFEENFEGTVESISVTMGGKDITESAFANGRITITNVTGNIVVTATVHKYDSVVTAPTCTEQGYTTHTCSVCGNSYVDSYVGATGHTFGEWYAVTEATPTEPGEKRRDCEKCDYFETKITKPLGYYSAKAEVLADGESLVLTERNIVMTNKHMFFSGKVESLGEGAIRLGHGKGSYYTEYIEITAEKLNVYIQNSSVEVKQYNHGLKIEGNVEVSIDVDSSGKGTIVITTDSGKYTRTVGWSGGRTGKIFCEVEGTAIENVDCRWWCDGFSEDIWLFGDSYFSISDSSRWTYHMVKDGHTTSLLAGYGGMGAADGLAQFKEFIKFEKPTYVIWCLGMNNGDRNDTINQSWLTSTEEFIRICEENGIIPILSTIPTTPTINNRLKNEWVENSGYRYVDFDLAVVANHSTGEWLEGMLSSDNCHPAKEGAEALYRQFIADFPEIGSGDYENCIHKILEMGERIPDCEHKGRQNYWVCSLCGGAFADAEANLRTTTREMILQPTGHTFGEWYAVTEATPTEPGEERRDCEKCDYYETREIPAKGYELGDINLDGKVDVMDTYYIRLVVAKLRKPTEQQILLGDVDLDGKITAIDANIIRKFSIKIIETLPVQ